MWKYGINFNEWISKRIWVCIILLFSNVFLGQNVSCIICVTNKSKYEIENVICSAELITPQNNYILKDRRSSHAKKTGDKLPDNSMCSLLGIERNVQMVVSQTIIETGKHSY